MTPAAAPIAEAPVPCDWCGRADDPGLLCVARLDDIAFAKASTQWSDALYRKALARRHELRPAEQELRSSSGCGRGVQLVSLREMATRPVPRWRIYGLLHGITLLWAGPGTYKTFLAISWAVAVAAGIPWFGRKVVQGAVVFVVGEGALRSFYNRVFVAAIAAGIPPSKVHELPIFATEGPVNLATWTGIQAQELVAAARGVAAESGQVGLLVVDTVSRCVPGRENDQETMQGFIGTLDPFRLELGCEIVAIHHANADGERERGSSVLPAAVDGNLHVVPGSPDSQGRVPLSLHAVKLKEADLGTGDPIIRLLAVKAIVEDQNGHPLRDEAGLPLTTRYLVEAGPEDTSAEDSADAALLATIPPEGISASSLVRTLHRSKRLVLSDLARLAREGRARVTGRGRDSRWHLIGSCGSAPVPMDGNRWSRPVPPVPGVRTPGPEPVTDAAMGEP